MFNNNLIYKFYYKWWKNIDKSILFLIILLFSLGLFFSLVSTSLIVSDKLNTNSYHFFFKHLFFIGVGFFLIIFFSLLGQGNLIKLSFFLFIICLFFLILVPIIGVEVKGSKRWLDLPFLPNIPTRVSRLGEGINFLISSQVFLLVLLNADLLLP